MQGKCKLRGKFLLTGVLAVSLAGCAAAPSVEIGRPVVRVDPTRQSSISGVGVESNDINAVADKMVRSMLTVPVIARAKNPPTVALLPVKNNTRFAINQSLFLKLMKAKLNSKARGRIYFLAREQILAIQQERKLKRRGKTDFDASKTRKAVAGADYFLTGSMDGLSTAGRRGVSDYILYTFKLIDTESSIEVWEDLYQIKKQGLDDVIYR